MDNNDFFPPHDGVKLGELALHLGAELLDQTKAERLVRSVSPVARAGDGDVCYILSRKYRDDLKSCNATAIICEPALQSLIPPHIAILSTPKPHAAFARAGALLHPKAMRVVATVAGEGISPAAYVDPTARLEEGVTVEPMAVIGAQAEIGAGTRIGAGAVIGADVRIGRNCCVAAGASVICALIGNGVIIHNGARIGQDGFGFAPGPAGMLKMVQIGRVIIQDNVEIGANTTIDRGAMDDTVIGEGTKIDNQVQIGHNVTIGRHCLLAAQIGLAGSLTIGDNVALGAKVGINNHLKIGDGAQVTAMSAVKDDIPPGGRWGGHFAKPTKQWFREIVAVERLAQGGTADPKGEGRE